MVEKSCYAVALMIALVVLAKSISSLRVSSAGVDLIRGGMFANVVDLVASSALMLFAAVSLSTSFRSIDTAAAAIVVLSLLAGGVIVHAAYAVAYDDVRTDFVIGVLVYAIAISMVAVARRRQLFATVGLALKAKSD